MHAAYLATRSRKRNSQQPPVAACTAIHIRGGPAAFGTDSGHRDAKQSRPGKAVLTVGKMLEDGKKFTLRPITEHSKFVLCRNRAVRSEASFGWPQTRLPKSDNKNLLPLQMCTATRKPNALSGSPNRLIGFDRGHLPRPEKPNCTNKASQAGQERHIGGKRSVAQFSREVCHRVSSDDEENRQNAIRDVRRKVTVPATCPTINERSTGSANAHRHGQRPVPRVSAKNEQVEGPGASCADQSKGNLETSGAQIQGQSHHQRS